MEYFFHPQQPQRQKKGRDAPRRRKGRDSSQARRARRVCHRKNFQAHTFSFKFIIVLILFVFQIISCRPRYQGACLTMFNYKPSDWKMENRGLRRATILKTPVGDKYDIGAVLGSYERLDPFFRE